ncbi:YdcH family protein [Ferruginivarius sediminum]|jgi:hypothetical protein|uniref:DUF465 domain-containing protein n=1 Tax=Ferruginivarius sediminum TaxID=2661937 RepID=A0A369T8W0_9PROT|nr:DUF465 domain-containing protein [Ferruginivarius sediminum]RDD61769.1 DUF465 domain-containing protein [Ferruginivarius sediminum]
MTDEEKEEIRRRLELMKSEHRDLDDVIARISDAAPYDQLQMKRLKKRKLVLKDTIEHLQSKLVPDIIA